MRDDDTGRSSIEAARDPLWFVGRDSDEAGDVVGEGGAGELRSRSQDSSQYRFLMKRRDGGDRTWFVVESEKALCSMSMRMASKPAALATPTISTDVQSLIDMDEKHSSRASAALARLRTMGVAPFFIVATR